MKSLQRSFKEFVHYDPATGVFTNIKSRGRARKGSRAGTWHTTARYRYITVAGFKRAERQWAFVYMIGRFPKNEVDHANSIKDDNRWCNLREANRFQNLANSKVRRNGLKGATKARNKWESRIRFKGKELRLGLFETELEAHTVYVTKAKELHGEFARAK